ncbi:MAG: glycine cleavage system protein GcvH [Bacteroidota bacterium]|nr:glycine cleavage system protein GcvH [Bacteroidota bacterium]MDP4232343.1 glycine cleavage system protein GcvH [Bacteroidota bacterium]MDP4241482.1 glycine cleavage system protein GcvH [Bacteroidota bacterium]MDP4286694.1 glycine cleavage system protein GcvH [Bacteroidota bacterium]
MNFPNDLKYTKDHEWLRTEGTTGTIGITDYAQGELGDVIYLDLKSGHTVNAHESLGTIEAVKTVSDLYTPVGGKVLEVNSPLNDSPETVNKDPYGAGWLAKIQLSNPKEADALLSADEYKKLIGQ